MRVPALLIISLLTACAGPPCTDDRASAEVVRAVEAYYDTFSARDWDAFADHFWPRATLTTVWTPPGEDAPRVVSTTIPEFVEMAPQGPGSKPIFEERMTAAEVRVTNDLAQVWAHYEAKFGDETELMEWSGVDAITLMKHAGGWRIVGIAYTSEH